MNSSKNKLNDKISWQKISYPNGILKETKEVTKKVNDRIELIQADLIANK